MLLVHGSGHNASAWGDSRGFYAGRRGALNAVVRAGSHRRCIEVDANHNVPMTRPEALAQIILDVIRSG